MMESRAGTSPEIPSLDSSRAWLVRKFRALSLVEPNSSLIKYEQNLFEIRSAAANINCLNIFVMKHVSSFNICKKIHPKFELLLL